MSWKRALFVGCNHGFNADPVALKAILTFKKDFKPHSVIHLGDWCDTTAFRSGARGTKDEQAPIDPDVDEGLRFVKELGTTTLFCGNHEHRLWRSRENRDPFVAYAANKVVSAIEQQVQRYKMDLVLYNGIWQKRMFGNFRAMHGVFYSEHASRDHAEKFGNVIHAHSHRAAHAKGRREDNPTGLCVGTLARSHDMEYANLKASTLAWSQGFVWGEYNETRGVFWLHEHPMTETVWRLP